MSGRTLECVGNGQTGTVTFHVDPVVGEWLEYVGCCWGGGGGGGGWREIGHEHACINPEFAGYWSCIT